MRRVWAFVALWVAAFAFLPTLWVAWAALGWGLLMIPDPVDIYRDFQHVPKEEGVAPSTG